MPGCVKDRNVTKPCLQAPAACRSAEPFVPGCVVPAERKPNMKLVSRIAAIVLLLSGSAAAQPPTPKLALSPCNAAGFPSDALCGTYEVFENRAARAGRKIP